MHHMLYMYNCMMLVVNTRCIHGHGPWQLVIDPWQHGITLVVTDIPGSIVGTHTGEYWLNEDHRARFIFHIAENIIVVKLMITA